MNPRTALWRACKSSTASRFRTESQLCLRWQRKRLRLRGSLCRLQSTIGPLTGSGRLDPAALTITRTTAPKPLLPPERLVFGNNFTDHMLSVEYTLSDGWLQPSIVPYQNLSLDPATCVFHYGFECFEGMKAYKGTDGKIRLFRPDKNMERLNKSAARIALPTLDGGALVELIKKLVLLDERFLPNARGYSLYLRPTLIGTQRTLGVAPPSSALLFVICSPVGPYYPTGFKAVSLEATRDAVRAWPGGVGDRKLGANYAPCIVPQQRAMARGLHQNLWLFGDEQRVTEVGTMNFFVALRDRASGRPELATPPLDGTILEGVTRDSVLGLARERLAPEGWTVSERYVTMYDIATAADEGRLIEAFGAGTAATVSPIKNIVWHDREISCGLPPGEEAGETAKRMKDWIESIQYGDEPNNPWSTTIS